MRPDRKSNANPSSVRDVHLAGLIVNPLVSGLMVFGVLAWKNGMGGMANFQTLAWKHVMGGMANFQIQMPKEILRDPMGDHFWAWAHGPGPMAPWAQAQKGRAGTRDHFSKPVTRKQ